MSIGDTRTHTATELSTAPRAHGSSPASLSSRRGRDRYRSRCSVVIAMAVMVVVVVQMVRVWRYGATDWGCYGGGDGSGVRDRDVWWLGGASVRSVAAPLDTQGLRDACGLSPLASAGSV